jgi:alkylation response protein AidB-like acyl-CoA dehydrogenase
MTMTAGARVVPDADLLDKVRAVSTDVLRAEADHVDRGNFPWRSLRALADADVTGLWMPRELGGQQASTSTYAEAVAAIAAECGSTSTVYMTQMHCAHPILMQGSEVQRARWIPRICSCAAIGAIAVTEPGAGSDAASMRTVARRDGDDYIVDGTKTFISNGDVADVVVLFATVDPSRGTDGITAFLVETERLAGFHAGTPMKKLGQKGASTVELHFDNCRIPASSRMGDEGDGYQLLLDSVSKSRISAAAQGVGFAVGAYASTARYLADRGLLSSRSRQAQDIQFALADIRAQIEAARNMLRSASDLVDQSVTEPVLQVSMLKLHCTALGVEVAARCVELLGTEGDRRSLGVERRLRDAKITEIYDGTSQVQRMLIARHSRDLTTL